MKEMAEGKTSEQIREELIEQYQIQLTDEQRNGLAHVHGEID